MYLYQHLLTAARIYLMCICSLWPSSRTRLLHVLIEAWFYLVLSIVHLFYRARRSEGKYTIRKQVIYIYINQTPHPLLKLPIFMRYGTLIYIYWQGHFLFISFFFWTNKWTWIYIKQVSSVNSVWTTYCYGLYKSLFLYIMWPHMGFELVY